MVLTKEKRAGEGEVSERDTATEYRMTATYIHALLSVSRDCANARLFWKKYF